MTRPVHIAVVMACHNRREMTLRSLAGLFAQQSEAIGFSVHLLDDGSDDGTAAAVLRDFAHVTLLHGDSNRFWGGGMYDAMRSAGTDGYDFMLWLNDDVVLHAGAVQRLLDAYDEARTGDGDGDGDGDHIIVGACIDPNTGLVRYGGLRRRSRWHPARLAPVHPDPARLMRCDAMHGNCVLVPVTVVRRVGFVDPVFVHQSGDVDYAYRAVRAGVALWVARSPIGDCRYDVRPQPWLAPGLGLADRWRVIDTPLGYPVRSWMRFMWRHGGIAAVLAMTLRYVRLLFPSRADRETVR